MQRRMHIFAITGAVALASLNLFYLALSRGWFGPFERAGAGFCECFRPGLVKQPANTWSNLGFVAAGLAMAWSRSIGTFSRNRNALTQSSFNAIFFSSLVVLPGPGSMAMHASGAKFGGFLDVLSMYLVDGFRVAYSARRLVKLDNIFFALIFSVVLAACLVADRIPGKAFLNFGYGNVAFGSFIILTTIFEAFNIFARKMTHASAWAFGSFGAIV